MAVGIQQDDVFGAADSLIRDGLRPTIERVRQKLGRGSPNTVSPLLDNWFQTLGPRLSGTAHHGLNGVPGPVTALAQKFWESAMVEARKELAAREALLAQERLQWADQQQADKTRFSNMEYRLEQANSELVQARQHLQTWQEKEAASQSLAAALALEARASHVAAQSAREALDELRRVGATETAKLLQQHAATEKHWAMETHRAREAAKHEVAHTLAQSAKLKESVQVLQVSESDALSSRDTALKELQAQIRITTELKAALDSWQVLEVARASQQVAQVRRTTRDRAPSGRKSLQNPRISASRAGVRRR